MPRAKSSGSGQAAREQAQLLWGMGVDPYEAGVLGWDWQDAVFCEAVREVLSSGASIFMRPGSGGRAIGIAIWEGDHRHPPKWLYEGAEIEEWATGVCRLAKLRRGTAAD